MTPFEATVTENTFGKIVIYYLRTGPARISRVIFFCFNCE